MTTKFLTVSILLASALFSCKPQERPDLKAAATGDSLLNSWAEVHEVTRCDSMSSSQCLGYFGFSVRSNGEYVVGAADGGAPSTGTITPQELEQLNDIAENLAGQNLASDMKCQNSPLETADRDSVDVTLSNESNYLVYDNEGSQKDLCIRGDQDDAQKLHDAVRSLMEKYYAPAIY